MDENHFKRLVAHYNNLMSFSRLWAAILKWWGDGLVLSLNYYEYIVLLPSARTPHESAFFHVRVYILATYVLNG
jgi:hypothetical protein